MFITIEGPEGSGKSTAAKKIFETLLKENYDVIFTREPGGTPIAEKIREVILDKTHTALDGRAEALLYAASRRQHLVEKIWPALKENKIVICDRYLDSSLAYQGGARGLGVDNVLNINLFATENTFPDVTLLFDVDPEIGFKRIAANKNREVNRLDLESREFHKKVRDTFLELAARYHDRYIIIDASLDEETVFNNALKAIKARIENNGN